MPQNILLFHGLGFVLTPNDPYVAVDLDACIHEHEIDQSAMEAIEALKSYTEISPSGQGLRILLACPQFRDNTRRAAIEVYSHSRYITITGQQIDKDNSRVISLPHRCLFFF